MSGRGFIVVPPIPTFLLLTPYSLAANGVGEGKTVPRIRHERPHFFRSAGKKASLEKHKGSRSISKERHFRHGKECCIAR